MRRAVEVVKIFFHPAFLASAVSFLAFVVAIFMGYENSNNKGRPRDGTFEAFWMKQTLDGLVRDPRNCISNISICQNTSYSYVYFVDLAT